MGWELAERLRARFPEVEIFPRPDAPEPSHDSPDVDTPAPATPARPARGHADAKAPMYHVPGAWVPATRLLEICRVVRDEASFDLDYCSFVSAVDWPQENRFEVVYHLYSMSARHELLLKVRVPRDAARVPSVTGIWAGANWHEREAYDLFGIVFDGHPDLRRIMMTEDWTGHPLRKDYVYEEPRWLVELATQRQNEIEGLGLGERS